MSRTFALVGLILLSSKICGLAQPKDASLCFPTKVGAKWVYDENGKDVTDILTASEPKVDGSRIVSIGRVAADGSVVPAEKLLVTDWCVFRVQRGGDVEKPATSLLILPLGIEARAVKPDLIEVPGGSFSAYPVRLKTFVPIPLSKGLATFYETRWYSPVVGLVKSESGVLRGEEKQVQARRVLKRFTPGKD